MINDKNNENERGFLKSVTISVMNYNRSPINPKMFTMPYGARIYEAIGRLWNLHAEPNIQRIQEMDPDIPFDSLISIFSYGENVYDGYHRQKIVAAYEKEQAYKASIAIREMADAGKVDVGEIYKIVGEMEMEEGYTFKSFDEMMEDLKMSVINRDKRAKPIPTGFKSFDSEFGGFRPCDFAVIGAFTNDGKSTLMMNMAMSAVKAGYPVGVISIEEDYERYAIRLASYVSRINGSLIYNGTMSEKESAVYFEKVKEHQGIPLICCYSPGTSVTDVHNIARHMIKQNGIKMLVIDYLQLVQAAGGSDIRERMINIVLDLTSLCRRERIVLLTASQLNREGATKPTLGNLSESSKIEHQADYVFMIISEVTESNGAITRTPTAIRLDKSRMSRKGITVPVRLNGNAMTFVEVNKP